MSLNQETSNHLKKLYNQLKTYKTTNEPLDYKFDCENPDLAMSIVAKIAAVTSEEEFIQCLVEKDLPAIKLSAPEMEFVKGGGHWHLHGVHYSHHQVSVSVTYTF